MKEGTWNLEAIEDKAAKTSQWGLVGSRTYKGYPPSHVQLPAGAYSITLDRNDDTPIFIKKDIKTDHILPLENSLANNMLKEIDIFWNKGDLFKKVGFLHRRGYMLYGPQGTGKSGIVHLIVVDIIRRGGLVLLCENPKFFNRALAVIRQVEPDRNLVCIFEDIDAIIECYGEDELLSVLDGANMVDRCLNIATTNYPEKLDKRLVSRPRRFDRVIKIDQPSEKLRREYFKMKLPKKENVERWVKLTEGLSFAGMTEAIISVLCLGNRLEHSINVLKELEKNNPSSEEFGTRDNLGFGNEDL